MKCEGTTAEKEQLKADLERESKLMQTLQHKFVIQLIGSVSFLKEEKLIRSSEYIMMAILGELSPSLWTVQWIVHSKNRQKVFIAANSN